MTKIMRTLAVPLRMLLMACAVVSLFLGYLQGIGLYAAIVGGIFSVGAGLSLAQTKLRKRGLLLGTLLALLGTWLLGRSIGHFSIFASIFGISVSINLQLIVYGFGFVFFVATLLRTLSVRLTSVYFFEFWVMALSAAAAFAPHRNHIILQPLWLSDWAWEHGLEPTFVLGGVGCILALLLGVVILFEQTKRIPVVLLFLPLLALLAFRFIDPTELNEEEPPSSGNEILKSMQGKGDPIMGEGGGKGKKDPREEGLQKPQDEKSKKGESSPVAVVILETDFIPTSGYFYLRQEGLSSYAGKRLNASRDREIPYDGIVGFPSIPTSVDNKVESDARKDIKGTVSLLVSHTAPFGVESITYYEPTINPRPGMFNRTYAFESSAQDISYEDLISYEVGDEEWPDKVWEHFTEAPSDPRYKELADEIIGTLPEQWADNPFAQALSIKLYLDEKTRYTKKVRHANASDPTGEFLFGPVNQFIGYCVHTSHAAVYLWRSIGIPARVGVGYAVDAQNAKTDGFVVNDIDAHAWPELYFEGVGWIALDIAPAENLDQSGDPPDPSLRDSLMELARAQEESKFREPIDWAALWARWKGPLLMGLCTVLCIVIGGHYLIKIYRRFRPSWSSETRHAYISAIDSLSEKGILREEGETPEAFARRVSSDSFVVITNAHVAASLGVYPVGEVHVELGKISKEISDVSMFRRFVGILNPFSFYFSR